MNPPKIIHAILLIDIPQSLAPSFQVDLQDAVKAYFENCDDILYAVNGEGTHIHVLAKTMKGNTLLSEWLQGFKTKMQERMNKEGLLRVDLRWKPEHFAFEVENSEIHDLLSMIKSQKVIHAKQSFEEEFVDIVNSGHVIIDGNNILLNIQ
ncbi:MAG: hypothetical protein LBV02_00805 [Bacteroidales bacterium]|jgi:aromatic ring-opening dioxygenase catalytic subunit (LigB family)|nr:hypothetical protein [Bacteroidales bacterium]